MGLFLSVMALGIAHYTGTIPACFGGSAPEPKLRSLPLKPIVPQTTESSNRAEAVAGQIVVMPTQPRASEGLQFTLLVQNSSAEALEMWDPSDLIYVELTNEADLRVELPKPPSSPCKVNASDNAAFEARWKERRPFELRPTAVGAATKTMDAIRDGKILLEPGQTFAADVVVPRTMADPAAYWNAMYEWMKQSSRENQPDSQALPIAPIAPGTYRMKVRFELAPVGKTNTGGGRSLASDEFVVHLGVPPKSGSPE